MKMTRTAQSMPEDRHDGGLHNRSGIPTSTHGEVYLRLESEDCQAEGDSCGDPNSNEDSIDLIEG